jgi:uncharacterized MAPEG superfamily protein
MEAFIDNLAFRTYAVCAAIIALKVLLSAVYTGLQRRRSQGYTNAEDASSFGEPGAATSATDAPAVARALRIQRNDAENIPAFYAIGLIYVLSGATPNGAFWYMWTYTAARVLHTFAYMFELQPWRAICFLVGLLCQIGMITSILF